MKTEVFDEHQDELDTDIETSFCGSHGRLPVQFYNEFLGL